METTKTLKEETEEKKARFEEELNQRGNFSLMSRLAAGVIHEIKNSMGIINISVYYLKGKVDRTNPKVIEHLSSIERQVSLSEEMVSNFLGLSNQKKGQICPTDVNNLIDKVLVLVKYQLSEQGIKIIKRYHTPSPHVMVDPNQIRQVFLNLILNAQEAMPEGGELSITTRPRLEKNQGEIEFTDTGCGIREEDLSRIFEPFFSTKEDSKGTGLGLSISSEIVEKHGGSITVRSSPGKGTTFTVTFPGLERREHDQEKE